MQNTKTSYLRFLNLIDAIDRMNPGKKLDCTEEDLLDKIVLASYAKKVILVGDLISLSELGSQATLHGRLKNLSAMGYIKMAANVDGRKKKLCQQRWRLNVTKKFLSALRRPLKRAKKTLLHFFASMQATKKPLFKGLFYFKNH